MMTPDPRVLVRSFQTALEVTDGRTVEGLVVPYNQPAPITELRADGVLSYREEFARGAFERATRPENPGRVHLLYTHEDTLPNHLGVATSFTERDDGLYGVFRLDASTADKARDVLSSSHSGLSVSFISLLPKAFTERAGQLVTRRAAHLVHVAAVATPAYAAAGVTSIRAGEPEEAPSSAELAAQAAAEEQRRMLDWVDQVAASDPWAGLR